MICIWYDAFVEQYFAKYKPRMTNINHSIEHFNLSVTQIYLKTFRIKIFGYVHSQFTTWYFFDILVFI